MGPQGIKDLKAIRAGQEPLGLMEASASRDTRATREMSEHRVTRAVLGPPELRAEPERKEIKGIREIRGTRVGLATLGNWVSKDTKGTRVVPAHRAILGPVFALSALSRARDRRLQAGNQEMRGSTSTAICGSGRK